MEKLLLVVEESFQITGRGVVAVPETSPEAVGSGEHGHTSQVRLVRPDTTEEVAEATFWWEHLNPGGFRFMLMLRGIGTKKEQAPPGTEVWLIDA